MLEKHGSLDLKWKFNYPNVNSTRPNEIIYDVFHNGKLLDTLTFINMSISRWLEFVMNLKNMMKQ